MLKDQLPTPTFPPTARRVVVTSSNFSRYDRYLNTGVPNNQDAAGERAINTPLPRRVQAVPHHPTIDRALGACPGIRFGRQGRGNDGTAAQMGYSDRLLEK